nr:Erv1/Alr family FAD-linked sulfhydryl oxidase [Sicyoidochytrium minutum DNA virus]
MSDEDQLLGDGSYPARFVEFFGPSAWKFMHSVAFTFPHNPSDLDKENYATFFKSIAKVIPCPSCAKHFEQYVHNHPPDTESRESLSRWTYRAQDLVNRSNNKESPKYEEVAKLYNGWTKADLNRYNKLTNLYKKKRMADPHFNKLPGKLTQNPFDDFSSRNIAGLVLIIILLVITCVALYMWWSSRKR